MIDWAFENGADENQDGSLDINELTKLMSSGPPQAAAQKKKRGKRCGKVCRRNRREAKKARRHCRRAHGHAQTAAKSFAMIAQSPSDIIAACDTTDDAKLSRDEAHTCIDKFVKDKDDNEEAHELVDWAFDDQDIVGSDDEMDEEELADLLEDPEDSDDDYDDEDDSGDESD